MRGRGDSLDPDFCGAGDLRVSFELGIEKPAEFFGGIANDFIAAGHEICADFRRRQRLADLCVEPGDDCPGRIRRREPTRQG